MKIVIAPDSFKGSLSATEAALAIELGFSHAFPNSTFIRIPMSDGGDGFLESLFANTSMERHSALVTNPLGEKITADFGILEKTTAIIEMATASGLTLVPLEKRNPLKATSFGTGELILAALEKAVGV